METRLLICIIIGTDSGDNHARPAAQLQTQVLRQQRSSISGKLSSSSHSHRHKRAFTAVCGSDHSIQSSTSSLTSSLNSVCHLKISST